MLTKKIRSCRKKLDHVDEDLIPELVLVGRNVLLGFEAQEGVEGDSRLAVGGDVVLKRNKS